MDVMRSYHADIESIISPGDRWDTRRLHFRVPHTTSAGSDGEGLFLWTQLIATL
jgi:hypothetical protein